MPLGAKSAASGDADFMPRMIQLFTPSRKAHRLLHATECNSKELSGVHLVEEFTPPPIRASVLRMKIDCEREFEDAAQARQGSFGEGLTGTFKSIINNPVLPSEFDFFARSSQRAQPDVYSPATSKCEGSA